MRSVPILVNTASWTTISRSVPTYILPPICEYSPSVFTRIGTDRDRKSTRLNSSHSSISYAVFCLKKKKNTRNVYVAHPLRDEKRDFRRTEHDALLVG